MLGVDSSAEMIEAARALESGAAREAQDVGWSAGRAGVSQAVLAHTPGLSFVRDDIRDWEPRVAPDVIVWNAVLQWLPDHDEVLVRWAGLLRPEGWLAFQLPGNFDQPSQVILREMASSSRWRPLLGDVRLNRQSSDPAHYAELLIGAGCAVDAWETTYMHILPGANPVLEWVKGTAMQPVLAALDSEQAADFLAEYGERALAAYPPGPAGTVFPFRRVSTVAFGFPSSGSPARVPAAG